MIEECVFWIAWNQKPFKYIKSQEIWTSAPFPSIFCLDSLLILLIGFNQEQWLL